MTTLVILAVFYVLYGVAIMAIGLSLPDASPHWRDWRVILLIVLLWPIWAACAFLDNGRGA
jgi:hypothetical protein